MDLLLVWLRGIRVGDVAEAGIYVEVERAVVRHFLLLYYLRLLNRFKNVLCLGSFLQNTISRIPERVFLSLALDRNDDSLLVFLLVAKLP